MRLNSLEVVDLHDSINLDLTFNDHLNLLVGINGSGKTSALHVIDWMLTPNLAKLATVSYRRLTINFEFDSKDYKLTAIKNDFEVLLKMYGEEVNFAPINIQLNSSFGEERYQELRPEEHEIPLWRFLEELKRPTIVSLERTLTAEVSDEIYSDRPARVLRNRQPTVSPLEHVQKIFSEQYSAFRAISRKNDSDLKLGIILTALHSPGTDEQISPKLIFPKEDAEHLETKVQGYLAASISEKELGDQVQRFFSYFRSLSAEVDQSSDSAGKLSDLIQAQFDRVDQLAKAFNEFEEKNRRAFSRLNEFLGSVNRFLIDSGKQVIANDATGRLEFVNVRRDYSPNIKSSIAKLSSGETQIVILFALIAFEASPDHVFIVDEPELSLHPKWQVDFMDSFLSLCPQGSQIFIATHSPEIAGKHKNFCILL